MAYLPNDIDLTGRVGGVESRLGLTRHPADSAEFGGNENNVLDSEEVRRWTSNVGTWEDPNTGEVIMVPRWQQWLVNKGHVPHMSPAHLNKYFTPFDAPREGSRYPWYDTRWDPSHGARVTNTETPVLPGATGPGGTLGGGAGTRQVQVGPGYGVAGDTPGDPPEDTPGDPPDGTPGGAPGGAPGTTPAGSGVTEFDRQWLQYLNSLTDARPVPTDRYLNYQPIPGGTLDNPMARSPFISDPVQPRTVSYEGGLPSTKDVGSRLDFNWAANRAAFGKNDPAAFRALQALRAPRATYTPSGPAAGGLPDIFRRIIREPREA